MPRSLEAKYKAMMYSTEYQLLYSAVMFLFKRGSICRETEWRNEVDLYSGKDDLFIKVVEKTKIKPNTNQDLTNTVREVDDIQNELNEIQT